MALDEKISGLIGRIYDGVDQPDSWEAVLHEIRAALGVRCLLESVSDFGHHQMQRSTLIGDPRRPEGVEEYRSHAYELDASFRWAISHPYARFCDTSEIMPADDCSREEFVKWNQNEWIGSKHWIVGYTPPNDKLAFGLSAHPWADDGPLSGEKKALFKMLFEHMERAIRLASHPPLFASESEALVLLDRAGRIRAISPAAQDLLDRNDGLAAWDNHLHAAVTAASDQLNTAILSALSALETGGFGGAVAIPRPSGKRDLLVTVVPLSRLPSPFDVFRPAALVRIVEPELDVSESTVVKWSSLFGLTPAEARLAAALVGSDQDIRAAADELGITYSTARVHLKRLFEKTDTHSQSQLYRLLTRVGA